MLLSVHLSPSGKVNQKENRQKANQKRIFIGCYDLDFTAQDESVKAENYLVLGKFIQSEKFCIG